MSILVYWSTKSKSLHFLLLLGSFGSSTGVFPVSEAVEEFRQCTALGSGLRLVFSSVMAVELS